MMKAAPKWFFFFLLLSSLHVGAQITIKSGTALTVQSGSTLSLQQSVFIQNGATLHNSGIISFKENFTNNGVSNFGNGSRLLVNGNTQQNIGGSGILSFPHISLNNLHGLVLGSPLAVTDSLQLMKGLLYSSAKNPIHFTDSAVNPVETNNSYISGQAIMDTRHIGNNALDKFLGISITAGRNLENISIIRNTGADAVITSQNESKSIAANWTINTTQEVYYADRNVSFSWLSMLDNGNDVKMMDLYGSDSAYIKINQNSVDVSASNPRQFVQNSMTKFNRTFTLFDTSARSIIQLISFSGVRKADGVKLNWITGTEIYNYGFDVERSADGVHFTKIGFVAGKNQPVKNVYEFFDSDVVQLRVPIVYYRLKQIYTTQNYKYSPIILLRSGLYKFNIYPNPFIDIIKIDVLKDDPDPVMIRLIDAKGAIVLQQQYDVGKQGQIQIKGITGLAAGVYFINLFNGHIHDTFKLVKSHE